MAMVVSPETLSSLRTMILPGVWASTERANHEGVPIVDADLCADFASDELQLVVRHRLVSRDVMLDNSRDGLARILADRLQAAMRLFHRMPAAKALCVDRRRLNARGEKARKEANRPMRKSVKRRA